MKQINKIAIKTEQIIKNYQQSNEQDARTQQQSNHSTFDDISARDKARAAKVWIKMTEIFGTLLVSSFGETPPAAWSRAISKLNDIEVQRALTNCLKREDKYPPTLSEFLMLSRDERKHVSHKIYKRLSTYSYHEIYKKTGRDELKKIKEILR